MPTTNNTCKGITASGEPCKRIAGKSGFCNIHDPVRIAELQAAQEQAGEAQRLGKEREKVLIQQRKEKLELAQTLVATLETELESSKEAQRQYGLLESVSKGLYVEIEKLTKKTPAAEITELALEQINDVIKDTKALMQDDPYVKKLKEFIPAGDMPQLRDALLVLSQVRQGLGRFSHHYIEIVKRNLEEARIIETALKHVLMDKDDFLVWEAVKEELGYSDNNFPIKWQKEQYNSKYGRAKAFNTAYLDLIEIPNI